MRILGFAVIIFVPVIMYLFICRCDSIVNRIEFKLPFILLSVFLSVFFLRKSRLRFAVVASIVILVLFFMVREVVHKAGFSTDRRIQRVDNDR